MQPKKFGVKSAEVQLYSNKIYLGLLQILLN